MVKKLTAKSFEELQKSLVERFGSHRSSEKMNAAGVDHLVIPFDPTPAEVSRCKSHQAGSVAYWATLHHEAKEEVSKQEEEFKVWWAEQVPAATKEENKERTKSNPAPATAIENNIIRTHKEEYLRKKSLIAQAERTKDDLKKAVDAWDQRGMMLGPLSKIVLKEMDQTDNIKPQSTAAASKVTVKAPDEGKDERSLRLVKGEEDKDAKKRRKKDKDKKKKKKRKKSESRDEDDCPV